MAIRFVQLESPIQRAAAVAALVFCLALTFFFVKWSLANAVSAQAEYKEIAELGAALAPSDPQTHFAFAALLEKTFLPDDAVRSLVEYEKATALSPHNYLYWFALGRSRERAGDGEGAEKALRYAVELAPNYGHVRWALGNTLLRQGKNDEGFDEIRRAAESDPKFAAPAVTTGWELFGGDIAAIKNALGDSTQINAALAVFLSNQKRFGEALEIWKILPAEAKANELKQNGEQIYNQMLAAKSYRLAAEIYPQVFPDAARSFAAEQIDNGGFERDVKMRGATLFEWQISEGNQPQIGYDNQQKRGGERSLLLIYNSADGKNFRNVMQNVVIKAGKKYRFSAFYKSDLKAAATVRWEIVDAADGKVLAVTSAVADKTDWANLSANFVNDGNTEAVTIRLMPAECKSSVCPISGKIWFDDLELIAEN